MWMDPEKFDVNAFDKNGAGMYIKPAYKDNPAYKKSLPTMDFTQTPTDTGGVFGGGGLMGQQNTGGGMTMSTAPAMQKPLPENIQKPLDTMISKANDDADFEEALKEAQKKDQEDFEATMAELGIKTPQEIEAEKNREWNDNLIPTFSDKSRWQKNEDDGKIETGAKWLGNAGMSLWNIVGGTGNAVINPYDTGKVVVKTIDGTVGHGVMLGFEGLNKVWLMSDETLDRAKENADKMENYKLAWQVGEILIKPYTSKDEFAKTMWEDPARIVGDILTVVSAGAGWVSKLSQANKAKLISEVRLATTLEQKSALIQRAVNMVQLEKGAVKVMEISNKINPYISAPQYAVRGAWLLLWGAGNMLGSTASFWASQATGFSRSTITEILSNPQWKKTKLGEINEANVVDDLSNAINARKYDLSDLGSGYDSIRKLNQTVALDANLVDDIFTKAGIKIENGKLSFLDTNIWSKSDMTALQEAYDMYKMRVAGGEVSTTRFLNLRQAIDDTVGWQAQTTSKADKLVKDLRSAIDKAGKDNIPWLKELDTKYSDKLREYLQIEKDWLTKDIETGGMRLKDGAMTKIFNSDKRGRDRIFAQLDDLMPWIGDKIKAVNALRDVVSAGDLKVGLYSRSLFLGATAFSGGVVPAIGALILTNPRFTVPLLEAYGKISKIPSRIIQGIGHKIENGIRLIAPERKLIADMEKAGYQKVYSGLSKKDQMNFPPPNLAKAQKELIGLADEYNKYQGLDPIYDFGYLPVNKNFARSVAKNYDDLKKVATDPETVNAYKQLAREVELQYDFFKSKWYKFEPWTSEGQPYRNSAELIDDVMNNKHLYFFQWGEVHPYLGAVGKDGLSANDKLRAIHDLLGHSMKGYQFWPIGEENAFLKHSQMFSDEAVKALASETRGQNSWVNFWKQNYWPEGYKNIPPSERPYAEQKVALLDKKFTNPQSRIHDLNFKREGAFAKFNDTQADYMITTAYNPNAVRLSDEANLANQVKFKDFLKKNGYEFKEQIGKYDNEEMSIIIKLPKGTADQLKIDQFIESYAPQAENLRIRKGIAYRYDPRTYEAYAVDLKKNPVQQLADDVDNYYSEIDGKKYQLPLYSEAERKLTNYFEEVWGAPKKMRDLFPWKKDPLYYHGGSSAIEKFDLSKAKGGTFGKAVYLTDSPEIAKSYGYTVGSYKIGKQKLYASESMETKAQDFTRAKNLYEKQTGKTLKVEDAQAFWKNTENKEIQKAKDLFNQYLQSKGYTGIKEADTVAIFAPEKVTFYWSETRDPVF